MINPSGFTIVSMLTDGVDRNEVKDYRKKGNYNCNGTVQRRIIDQ
jgi:hypothetical protein